MNPFDGAEDYQAAVEEYCADAASGKNDDWATYDENESLEVLVNVWAILNRPAGYVHIDDIRHELEKLIKSAAERHAQSLLEQCRCYVPQPAYNATCPPEVRRVRECPIHGSEDYRRER